MNRKKIFNMVGMMLEAEAALMLLPTICAVIYNEKCVWSLLVSAAIAFAAGFVLYLFRKVPYLWFVSHLVVLGGSVCLFLSVVLFVI